MISLIIPVYNCRATVKASLDQLREFKRRSPVDLEIILVDDGSSDDTAQIIAAYAKQTPDTFTLIRLGTNCGKGAAVKAGMLKAGGDYIFFTDADLPYDLSAIPRAMKVFMTGADLVIGSRAQEQSQQMIERQKKRQVASTLFSYLANATLQEKISDTQCGFKGFSRPAALAIFGALQSTGFAFDVEVLLLAQQQNYRIEQIPVTLVHESSSTVSVARDSFRMSAELLSIDRRLNHKHNGLHILDLWYSLLLGAGIALLCLPTFYNLGVLHGILSHGLIIEILSLVVWLALVPAGSLIGLFILQSLPVATPDFRYQFGRYGIVGLFNTFLNAAVFNLLISLTGIDRGLWVVIFSLVAFLVTVSQGFYWSRSWTFRSTTPYTHAEYVRFFAVSAGVAVVNIAFIDLMINVIGAPAGLSAVIWANIALAAGIVISVIGNFFGYRLFVFAAEK
jgi:dolichyl-phosphate beta-glucosyltransferase